MRRVCSPESLLCQAGVMAKRHTRLAPATTVIFSFLESRQHERRKKEEGGKILKSSCSRFQKDRRQCEEGHAEQKQVQQKFRSVEASEVARIPQTSHRQSSSRPSSSGFQAELFNVARVRGTIGYANERELRDCSSIRRGQIFGPESLKAHTSAIGRS